MIVSKTNSANARPKAWNEHTTNLDRLELTLASIVAFLAPINAARLPGIYITYADIIAVLCILLMIFNRGLPNRFLGPMTGAYLAGLFLFCGALIISTIVNGDVVRGAIGIGQYLVAYLIFPIVLLRRSAREAMIITYAFLAAIAVVCLHGIIIISFNIDAGLTYISYSQRLRGLVERENEFGALLAMSAPLVIALGRAKLIHPMIAWVGLGGMLYTVMLTGSNTGIICFVIAFFAMMMTGKNVLRDGFFVLFLLSALLFAVGFFGVEILPNVFERRVVAAFNEGSISKLGTFAGRMELNGEALQLATNHLFAGAGFDQYREISPHGAPVHNVYLLVLVEGGFIALSGLLLILFALFGFASLAMSYPKTFREGLCLAITVLVFTIAISALPHIYARFLVLPWIVTMGLAMNISDLRSRKLSIADGFKKTDERSNRST